MDKRISDNLLSDLDSFADRKCRMDQNCCTVGLVDFSITPDGEVQACAAFPMSFGSLKEKTWKEIVESNALLESWRHCTMEEYEHCGDYEYCKCCKPCAGLNYIEHGNYRKPAESTCDLAKIRYRLQMRLLKGEDLLYGKSFEDALSLLKINTPLLERKLLHQ